MFKGSGAQVPAPANADPGIHVEISIEFLVTWSACPSVVTAYISGVNQWMIRAVCMPHK